MSFRSIAVEESVASDPSMSSSSIVLPSAAPEEERQSLLSGRQPTVLASPHASTMPPMSPSTLRSGSPTWSSTDNSSMWEDARPSARVSDAEAAPVLSRRASQEFVFVDDESEDGH